jgi:hypothetical protein
VAATTDAGATLRLDSDEADLGAEMRPPRISPDILSA